MQAESDELRIIFAGKTCDQILGVCKTPWVSILKHLSNTNIGKELREDIELESCDLGNQSVLHAVKVLRKPAAHLDLEVRIQRRSKY